jgi:hypothetical protein
LIVDRLDVGEMTQASGPGARLELLLPAQRHFVFKQQAESFRVIEAARFSLCVRVPRTPRRRESSKTAELGADRGRPRVKKIEVIGRSIFRRRIDHGHGSQASDRYV